MAGGDAGTPQSAGRQQSRERRGHEEKSEILDTKPFLRETHVFHPENVLFLPRGAEFRSSIAVELDHGVVRKRFDAEYTAAGRENTIQLGESARQVKMVQHPR